MVYNFNVGDKVRIALVETGVIVDRIEGTNDYQVKLDGSLEIIRVNWVDLNPI